MRSFHCRAVLLKAGVNKAGTDEKAIRELFWDRTPEQIKAIEAVYNDRRPENKMWDDLNSEFEDPNDRKMMDAFRRGDRVGAASAALVDATSPAHPLSQRLAMLARKLWHPLEVTPFRKSKPNIPGQDRSKS